ncbi:MAG: hypothetical protein KIS85_04325 [Anaerolineales bacterium]|nr:hypothetical protein [Anaerolineales bacterium]
MPTTPVHSKWQRREKKLLKKKQAMRISGRSVFTLQEIARRKAAEARTEEKKPKGRKRHA